MCSGTPRGSVGACLNLQHDVQRWYFMLGIDGVELRRFTQHSCQLGLIRSSDAGVDMLSKAESSMPLIAIPGPSQPSQEQWAAIFTLMVSVFTSCSPDGHCTLAVIF
jgi:hypothetical protein